MHRRTWSSGEAEVRKQPAGASALRKAPGDGGAAQESAHPEVESAAKPRAGSGRSRSSPGEAEWVDAGCGSPEQGRAARRGRSVLASSWKVKEFSTERDGGLARRSSFATALKASSIEEQRSDFLSDRVIRAFQSPLRNVDYLRSQRFAEDIITIAGRVCSVFEEEQRCLHLRSPVHILGDIHGNLEDLNFFASKVWPMGMSLVPGRLLFLGDYVDRGLSSLETVSYLFASKVRFPDKVFMIRGNHETRDVNGWEEHYGDRSFLFQCKRRFGIDMGERVWEACNQAFDRLPLAAIVDGDIFCVHGGIPRHVEGYGSRIDAINAVPPISGVNPPNDFEEPETHQVASDCLWSDPATEEQEEALDADGFGESLRGGGAICFGRRAVEDFLQEMDFSFVVRAHEAHGEGVLLSKGATVMTVFSTSKDHHQGPSAVCGCVLVDDGKVHVIRRDVNFPPRFVFPRSAPQVAQLSREAFTLRQRLGLIVDDEEDCYFDDDDSDDAEYV